MGPMFVLVGKDVQQYDAPDSAVTGPILVQAFVQYFFQGVIFSQGIKFFSRFPEDPVVLRVYVLLLVLLAVLQTASDTYKIWLDVIDHVYWWTTPARSGDYLLNGIICTLCEAFLIRRCWKFTGKNWWLLVILAFLSSATLAAIIVLTVRIVRYVRSHDEYADPLSASPWAFSVWVYGSLVLSLAETTILSVYLWRAKTGFNAVDRTLKHIIGITWESAALPCICFILGAGLYISIPVRQSTHVRHIDSLFVLAAGKLYTFGVIRTLNCRKAFRKRLASTVDDPSFGRHSLSDYQWDQAAQERPDSIRTMTGPSPLTLYDLRPAE